MTSAAAGPAAARAEGSPRPVPGGPARTGRAQGRRAGEARCSRPGSSSAAARPNSPLMSRPCSRPSPRTTFEGRPTSGGLHPRLVRAWRAHLAKLRTREAVVTPPLEAAASTQGRARLSSPGRWTSSPTARPRRSSAGGTGSARSSAPSASSCSTRGSSRRSAACRSTAGRTTKTRSARAGGRSRTRRRARPGARRCAEAFWPALHIDLRMVDTSDFVIAYCPTNVYSVGTPHEIILARQQRKPVLFVSPPVAVPGLSRDLRRHLELPGRRRRARACSIELEQRGADQVQRRREPEPVVHAAGRRRTLLRRLRLLPVPREVRLAGTRRSTGRSGTSRPRNRCCRSWPSSTTSCRRSGTASKNDYAPNDDWLLWDLQKLNGGAAVTDLHWAPSAD